MSTTETGLDLDAIRRRRVGGMKPSDDLVDALVAEVLRLRGLIAELTDSDPCSFDHDGGCQTHGYLSLKQGETCPMYDAQQIAALAEPVEQEAGQ